MKRLGIVIGCGGRKTLLEMSVAVRVSGSFIRMLVPVHQGVADHPQTGHEPIRRLFVYAVSLPDVLSSRPTAYRVGH